MTDFLNLRDHVIVITGAASGMGRAIAQAASREGARLVLSDFDGERLAATAGDLKGEVRHLRADVTRLPGDPVHPDRQPHLTRVRRNAVRLGIAVQL